MGFRTVIVLSNDYAHEWENDPELGKKISHAVAKNWDPLLACNEDVTLHKMEIADFPYGEIVEQAHADTQTLAILSGCGSRCVVSGNWRGKTQKLKELELLKAFAAELGYTIRKAPVKLEMWPWPHAETLTSIKGAT